MRIMRVWRMANFRTRLAIGAIVELVLVDYVVYCTVVKKNGKNYATDGSLRTVQ